MAEFNPITDLMPMDSSEESVDESSEQIKVIRTQLIETRNSVANVLNIIKTKNSLLDRDLDKIKSLNARLQRTIPRIPIMRGKAGVQFGDTIEEEKKKGGLNIPMLPPRAPVEEKVSYERPMIKQAADIIGNIFNIGLIFGGIKSLFKGGVKKLVKPGNKIVPTPGIGIGSPIKVNPNKTPIKIPSFLEKVINPVKKKFAPTEKTGSLLNFSRENVSNIFDLSPAARMRIANTKNFPKISKGGKLVREGNKLLEQEQRSNRLAKIFKFIKTKPKTRGRVNKRITRKLLNKDKLEKILRDADSKVFKSGQEADSIAAVVRKVLKEGDIGSANLTKSEKSTFEAFKKYLDDAIELEIFTKKDVGELRKFLRQSDVGGENINFEKVLEQLRKNVFGNTFFETGTPGAFLNTKPMSNDIAMLNTNTGFTRETIIITDSIG